VEGSGLDLTGLGCSLADGTDVACLPLHYCLQYQGKNVPPIIGEIHINYGFDLKQIFKFVFLLITSHMISELQVLLKLDSGSIIGPPRLQFLSLEGASTRSFTVQLRVGRRTCSNDWVYVVVREPAV